MLQPRSVGRTGPQYLGSADLEVWHESPLSDTFALSRTAPHLARGSFEMLSRAGDVILLKAFVLLFLLK